MQNQAKKEPNTQILSQKLQKDVEIILNDFKEFLREREEEEISKVHLDVDLVLNKINAPSYRIQMAKEAKIVERGVLNTHKEASTLYNPHFYSNNNDVKKKSFWKVQISKLLPL